MPVGVLLDLDNTIVECGQYYKDAQATFVDVVSSETGMTHKLVDEVFTSIDVASSSLSDGFKRTRFPRSFRAASLAVDAIAGLPPNLARADFLYTVGDSVFDAPYPLYPGAWAALEAFEAYGAKLILVSKGQNDVQLRKLYINGLERFFTEDNRYFVMTKSPGLYELILKNHDLSPESTWMIGDSMRDDIAPAMRAGLRTIHVQTKTGVWGYENEETTPTHSVKSLLEATYLVFPHLTGPLLPVGVHS